MPPECAAALAAEPGRRIWPIGFERLGAQFIYSSNELFGARPTRGSSPTPELSSAPLAYAWLGFMSISLTTLCRAKLSLEAARLKPDTTPLTNVPLITSERCCSSRLCFRSVLRICERSFKWEIRRVMTPVLCGCETFRIINVVISQVVVFMVDVIALGDGWSAWGDGL